MQSPKIIESLRSVSKPERPFHRTSLDQFHGKEVWFDSQTDFNATHKTYMDPEPISYFSNSHVSGFGIALGLFCLIIKKNERVIWIPYSHNTFIVYANKKPIFVPVLRNLFFLNRQTGWVVGNKGAIYKTNDGGVNWTRQHWLSGEKQPNLLSVFFLDENYGWAVGDQSIQLRTTDGGKNWYPTKAFSPAEKIVFTDVIFFSPSDGVVFNRKGNSFYTFNGGYSWKKWKDSPSAKSATKFTMALKKSAGK